MHGRMVFLALVALLLIPTAATGEPVTLHTGDRAPFDGVIVKWFTLTAAQETITVQAVQHLAGGGQVAVSSGAPQTVPAGAFDQFAVRIPVGRDTEFVATGASAGTQVAATLEPDVDGDGYGDDSQDFCDADATAHTPPCPGTQTIGSPLVLRPDPNGFAASGYAMDALQVAGPAAGAAPTGGVVVRWRFRAATTDPLTLQVLHPAGGGAFRVAAEASSATPAAGGSVTTADVRLPIATGDRIGVRSPGDLSAVVAMPAPLGEHLALFDPVPPEGSTATPGANNDFRLLAQADVEPDADTDGYGDLSQDVCPFDGTRHVGCTADLAVTAVDQTVPPAAGQATLAFTITNRGPDPANHVQLQLSSIVCREQCAVARLDPGTTFSFSTLVPGSDGETVKVTGTATSLTPDANPANDSAVATLTFAAPSAPPPPPAPPKPCANLLRGTTDDDFLRGTAFGDRIVGLDGRDLERGGPGDDCLEGGGGSDVMDGDGGNDRLSGGSGNDNMTGGAGDDKLTGGLGNDRVSAGPGNDTLLPGAGKDLVSAGAGNDTINAADGVRESIDCGAGRDTVRADRRDRLRGCEKVTRR